HHHESSDPYPADQRIERDAQLRGIVAHAREHGIHIETRLRPNTHLSGWLKCGSTLTVEVLTLLCLDQTDALSIAERFERYRGDFAIQRLRRRHALTHEAPVPVVRVRRLERLAGGEAHVEFLLEREAGEGRKEHHDARVHDVSAVPPAIARDQPHERTPQALTVDRTPCSDPL